MVKITFSYSYFVESNTSILSLNYRIPQSLGARYGQHSTGEEHWEQVHGWHDGFQNGDNETVKTKQGRARAS